MSDKADTLAVILSAIAIVLAILGFILPEQDGFLTSIVYDDINLPAVALGKGASAPDTETILASGNIIAYCFDGGVTLEQVYGSFEMVHTYKEGTDLLPHLHWMATTADAGNVTWFLEYSVITPSGSSTVTTINATSATTGAWKEVFTGFSNINGTNLTIGNQVVFRLYRNPTAPLDNYGYDAALLSVGIHHQIDSIGSRQPTIK